jgi:GNAT superfamily N-acetyltransferase
MTLEQFDRVIDVNLRGFEARGWLARSPSPADARQSLLRLTEAGHQAFAPLQQKSRDEAAALLAGLSPAARERLIASMAAVQQLLAPVPAAGAGATVLLRDPAPGDLGWVVQQHGEIYWKEYRFDSEFEALVASVAAKYLRDFDPAHDKGWIAEVDGERAGSVFVVRRSKTVAQLRLLILTPAARGRGLGNRLVEECIAFARAKGYRKLMLWTQSHLLAARAIYRSRGFRIVKTQPYAAFGQKMVSEVWELKL